MKKKTKNGAPVNLANPKCNLVHTYTARRTRAALMCLGSMDVYDIIKITGQTSTINLRKKICANELAISVAILGEGFKSTLLQIPGLLNALFGLVSYKNENVGIVATVRRQSQLSPKNTSRGITPYGAI